MWSKQAYASSGSTASLRVRQRHLSGPTRTSPGTARQRTAVSKAPDLVTNRLLGERDVDCMLEAFARRVLTINEDHANLVISRQECSALAQLDQLEIRGCDGRILTVDEHVNMPFIRLNRAASLHQEVVLNINDELIIERNHRAIRWCRDCDRWSGEGLVIAAACRERDREAKEDCRETKTVHVEYLC